MIMYPQSDDLFQDSAQIIESARSATYLDVDRMLILRNWLLGKRIACEKMSGSREERYGEKTITELAGQLTKKYGSGFDRRSLYWYVKFYKLYPEIVYSVSPQSSGQEPKKIVDSVMPQSSEMLMELATKKKLLSWTHYRVLIQVEDDNARAWYEAEALDQAWSVRTLQRNMLLYAKTDEQIQPDAEYQMSGNRISVKTLDLNLEFAEIAKQLNGNAKMCTLC